MLSIKHLVLMQARQCFLCDGTCTVGVHGFGLPGHDDCIKSLEIKVQTMTYGTSASELANDGTLTKKTKRVEIKVGKDELLEMFFHSECFHYSIILLNYAKSSI